MTKQEMQLQALGHPDQHFGGYTYAQHGDDLMILNLFKLMGIERPSYIDLGAHHPFVISNTALLYERGSRGINVEANPHLIRLFEHFRPEDVNVNCGVDTLPGRRQFYMYDEMSGRNTFSLEEVKSLEGRMTVRQTVTLDMKTLPQIVDEYARGQWPHLLTCDIEGLDYSVLESGLPPEPHGPLLVVVETRREHSRTMMSMMHRKGYEAMLRMGENIFFATRFFADKCYA